jgi:hypothetical protein
VSAAPAESGEVATTEYTVERGDNLTKLARKFNTTIDELIDLQDEPLKSRLTKNRNLIYIGEMLKVAGDSPAGTPAGEPPELNDGDISTINDIVKKLFTYYGDSGLDSYDKGDFYGISL